MGLLFAAVQRRVDLYAVWYNLYMWTVYVHTNLQNGRRGVGVTSKGVTGRWERVMAKANEIRCMRETADRDTYLGPKAKRQLLKLAGTLEYDVAIGATEWKHEEVRTTPNLVEALLEERRLVKEYGCRTPVGYNRSAGGEIPPYTNVIDLLAWVKELDS